MLKSPIEFVKDIESGRHFVLFYENAEYSRSICFGFLKAGMENHEHSFYITAKEDKDFFKNEFIEKMYGPNIIYDYNTTPNATFREELFHGQNISDFARNDGGGKILDDTNKEIVNVVNNIIKGNQNNNAFQESNLTKKSNSSRMVFRCLHNIETQNQVQNSIKWERNFRNSKLRKELPNTSLVCTYQIENIIETLKGKSNMHSSWMTELLEMYDGVIYARNNWTGAAFNFV